MTTHYQATRQGGDTPDRTTLLLNAVVERMQPGTTWHTPQHGRVHVLAVVDDGQIVYRTWRRRGRRWAYSVAWVYAFWLHDRDGNLSYKGTFALDNDPQSVVE